MKVELEKVLNFIRKKASEYELEGFKHNETNSDLARSCYAQCFAIEEVADRLEVTAEILGGTNEA